MVLNRNFWDHKGRTGGLTEWFGSSQLGAAIRRDSNGRFSHELRPEIGGSADHLGLGVVYQMRCRQVALSRHQVTGQVDDAHVWRGSIEGHTRDENCCS